MRFSELSKKLGAQSKRKKIKQTSVSGYFLAVSVVGVFKWLGSGVKMH
jgi:hypothetical protein